jgi:hypothetical protein
MSQPPLRPEPFLPPAPEALQYRATLPAVPWDGLAIASLILGLFFIPLVPAVIAIVLLVAERMMTG